MSEAKAKRDWNEARRTNRQRVNLRVTDAELAALEERAARLEVSVSAYVKAAAFGQPMPRRTSRPVKADEEVALRQMLAQLGKLGSSANQIARASNVLARAVVNAPLADVAEVQENVFAGRQTLTEINGQLQTLRAQLFDALNLK